MKEGFKMNILDLGGIQLSGNRANIAFQIGENNIIKFAKTVHHPIYDDIISKYKGIPEIYFEYPEKPSVRTGINDFAGLLYSKNEEYLSLLNNSIVYFATVSEKNGNAALGFIACSRGIFFKNVSEKFIPIENIKDITLKGDTFKIDKTDNDYEYPFALSQKNLVPNQPLILNLLRDLYIHTDPLAYENASYIEAAEQNEEEPATMYTLSSSKGIRMGFFDTTIMSTVYVKNDRAEFIIVPQRYNRVPVVKYDDIAYAKVKIQLSWLYLFYAIATCITVILPIIFIYLSINHKLEIGLKNGMKFSVYQYRQKNLILDLAHTLNEKVTKFCGHSVLM